VRIGSLVKEHLIKAKNHMWLINLKAHMLLIVCLSHPHMLIPINLRLLIIVQFRHNRILIIKMISWLCLNLLQLALTFPMDFFAKDVKRKFILRFIQLKNLAILLWLFLLDDQPLKFMKTWLPLL
jgi:hypothetical protein